MNGAFEVGAVSLRAQQRALETLANNVANINTPGFKRAEVKFSEVVTPPPERLTETERLAVEASPQNGGVRTTSQIMISSQGELQATGSAMDIALDGAGFIELMGADGESLLWRGGRIEVNRDGYLAAEGTAALRALIAVPDDATGLQIANDGRVTAFVRDGEALEIGQIPLVRASSDTDLEAIGSGLFRLSDGARLIDALPGEDGMGSIQQGMLEGSNVDMTTAMVEMLVLQRAYSASAQVIQTADQVASITNSLKR